MSKFIDADRLRAEIEMKKKTEGWCEVGKDTADVYYARGFRFACDFALSIIDSLQQEQPVTAVGKVFTNPAPKNIIVENDQWDKLLSQFDNGQRVRIFLVKEDAE